MAQLKTHLSKKRSLCNLLRATVACFIEETTGDDTQEKRDATTLRHEADCLITLYDGGLIDPVDALGSAPIPPSSMDPSESVPLTGNAG